MELRLLLKSFSVLQHLFEVGTQVWKEKEASMATLANPARITPEQEQHVVWLDTRYRPITEGGRPSGVIIVTDTRPEEAEELVKQVAPSMASSAGVDDDEPDMPVAFLFDPSLEESADKTA